MKPIELGGLCK